MRERKQRKTVKICQTDRVNRLPWWLSSDNKAGSLYLPTCVFRGGSADQGVEGTDKEQRRATEADHLGVRGAA